MINFKLHRDANTNEEWLETTISGKPLLATPQLNKGTAFDNRERHEFNLMGKLPVRVETLEEQVERAYKQLHSFDTTLQKNIYLTNLLNQNQVLFYKMVSDHLEELMPVIYTPIVGTAVKEFNTEFRQPRGLYLSYPDHEDLEAILDNRTNPEIDLIVVTDGEGVLGIGDQGIGGMDIPIAKLMVYTLCGGIDPCRTLPILLDVGTNNQALLDNPLYLGWRESRLSGKEYDDFIDHFVQTIKKKFPNVFLHWEDFGRNNARRHLDLYRDQICTFNDDMQGTGVVTLAAILAAIRSTQGALNEQRIVVFGGGTAGTGISDQIHAALVHEGISPEDAYRQFWMVDRAGLLVEDMPHLTDAQKPYAHPRSELNDWDLHADDKFISLEDVVKNVHPTVLIGCSSVPGAFNQSIIETMADNIAQPIVLPLSNPTENAEATPENILKWSQGRALIATGSPFGDVEIHGRTQRIAQCNNALAFPGLGLGIIASKAERVTENMLWAACDALIQCSPILKDYQAPLLPPLGEAREVAKAMGIAVAVQAGKDGVAKPMDEETAKQRIEETQWSPRYLPFRHCAED